MRALIAVSLFLLLAPAAQARDATVTSFDGTPIQLSFFPAEGGGKAPTVLEGHGWGGSRDTDPNSASSEVTGNVGVGALRRAGFNVLTWDARGFGNSGGTVEADSKDFEGRDVSALIDWLAQQPEAKLDAAGDPRVGMTGVSYAGGIELVSAAEDKRIDAIAPIIAWHSLTTSLYKEQTVKGGWASLLYSSGVPSSKNRLDPHITSAFTTGLSTGTLSAEDAAWFASRGPGDAVGRIRIPTLLVEGTADTLFTLREAIENYGILRANGVPAKMVWFCGGHGVCLTGAGPSVAPRDSLTERAGPAGHVESVVVAWLKRYLAGDASVDTGPRFEWLADDAKWRSGADYPLPQGAPVTASGSGTLALNPSDAVSGTPVTAGRALNAVDVAVKAPAAAQIVGEPRLTLTYRGTGAGTHVFAQLVDEARGVVVGNQATPIPVTLDGQQHTITRPLEAIAASAAAGARYTLQVTGGTMLYGPVRGVAAITFSAIGLSLPTVGPAATPLLSAARTCVSRRRFEIRLHGKLRSARVYVAGKRVRTVRKGGRLRATVDLRGRARSTVKVRVVARTTRGKTLRDTRTYRTCAAKR
ncbi:alpha/beta hydrolase family protein [Candidatus Solirubrobacter pratensis]|uniref:alpha/beta hydrolase family protein n=1 Tax=Candidatus Solirubrobacter pratensis TaxID=1298857 RepID=UPI00041E032B|nr:CocE/NonD family hydrolase [Candidatus Solirubrobacter pratensis]